ncbi:globin domain-containing protein [Streptomyces sp. NPDC051909]|uniref:globin domain-containing protein n=1 Tax=Streptomyces sp. NPDC051909 TaxID=3154944 RepID=UPI00342CCF87
MSGHQDDYHALVARHEAMRLRNRLLSPASAASAARSTEPGARSAPGTYDAAAGGADQALILRHLAAITPFGELIDRLYESMFGRHPYLRRLFPDSMEFQRSHLERAFWHMIDHLDRPAELAADFARLGREHRRLGVLPVHYEVFEASLVEALRWSAGNAWSTEAEAAWVRMLRHVSGAMVAGANDALGEPVAWNATVTGHDRIGPDLALLRIRPAEPYPYRAGQHARVETPLLPHTWRPYTPACVPGDELEFHVRRTAPGGVSDALVAHTGVGDVLRLGPPQGTATLDEELTDDIVIVAGGTGWAHAKALLDELSRRRPAGLTARLFLGARVGARDAGGFYDEAALERLEARCPWLGVTRVADASGGLAAGDERRGALLDAVLGSRTDWSRSRQLVYVSGPTGLVAATAWHLTEAGLPPERLRHDPMPVSAPGVPALQA